MLEKQVQQRRQNIKQGRPRWGMGPLQGLEEPQERTGPKVRGGKSPSPSRNVSLGFSGMESRDQDREWLHQHLQSEANMDNLRPK